MEVEAVPDTTALPDVLVIQILTSLAPSIKDIGRSRRVCTRWTTLAGDDAIWRALCASRFGCDPGAPPSDPAGAACASFFAAARAWCALEEHLGLELSALHPTLAPLHTRSRETWARLCTWSARELPEAAATIAPPASCADWAHFVKVLGFHNEASWPGLLALRVLSAVHDGQRISDDLRTAKEQIQGRGYGGEGHDSLEKRIKDGLAGLAPTLNAPFLGLCGGFSAYDKCSCVRPLPLLLIAAWSLFCREEYDFGEGSARARAPAPQRAVRAVVSQPCPRCTRVIAVEPPPFVCGAAVQSCSSSLSPSTWRASTSSTRTPAPCGPRPASPSPAGSATQPRRRCRWCVPSPPPLQPP
jgi:hypothetical protein